jgi:hypothetical protein
MNVSTKFNLGDRVWLVRKVSIPQSKPCPMCEATGRITYNDEKLVCPKCCGFKCFSLPGVEQWKIVGDGYIGQVDVRITPHGTEVRYMASTWGVGSGWVLHEDELFASEAKAAAWCRKQNQKESA